MRVCMCVYVCVCVCVCDMGGPAILCVQHTCVLFYSRFPSLIIVFACLISTPHAHSHTTHTRVHTCTHTYHITTPHPPTSAAQETSAISLKGRAWTSNMFLHIPDTPSPKSESLEALPTQTTPPILTLQFDGCREGESVTKVLQAGCIKSALSKKVCTQMI